MNTRVHKLLNKITSPLETQLCAAILEGKVQDEYEHSLPKQKTETNEQYIERIKAESENYQFVNIKDKNGSIEYVALGTPGSVINDIGEFWLIPGQVVGGKWGIHYFLVYPDFNKLKKQKELFIRIDSGCFIGMVFNDNTCDCKRQLSIAMEHCVKNGSGLIIEIPKQDGRGWGEYKMANQRITNELNINTVETARMFYGDDNFVDRRTYDEAALIFKALGFGSKAITLGSNNPKKMESFSSLGINIVETKAIIADNLSAIAKMDLKAKAKEWKHKVNI